MKGRWFITPHAIDAYRRRVRVCSYDEALIDLTKISNEAHYVREADHKAQLWRGPSWCRIRLIVGPGKGLPALITVLPAYDGFKMPINDAGATSDKVSQISRRIQERNGANDWRNEQRRIRYELQKYVLNEQSVIPECHAPKSFCPTCYDLAHRRSKPVCKGCGKKFEELPTAHEMIRRMTDVPTTDY